MKFGQIRFSAFAVLMVMATGFSGSETSTETEVWNTVLTFAKTWADKGDAKALRGVFHESMVTISPADRDPIHGREANIAAYERFLSSAKVTDWQFTDQHIQLLNDEQTAVVTFVFSVTMLEDDDTVTATGRDLLVLVKEQGKWWVAADHFSPFPSQ